MTILELLRTRRLVCCVGPGGVGKTTIAAALGVRAACEGRRVLVLTIDPARRLADALGLQGGDPGVIDVPLAQLRARAAQRGTLSAAMLDAKSSFDAMVQRLASDSAARQIEDNRLYRVLSRALARAHAQAAMELLYDVAHSGLYDLVILDTPPMRAALEILDAPRRLLDFFDSGVARWFLDPPRGRLSQLLPRGSAAVARLLSLLGSRRLVTEAGQFFGIFLPLEPSLRERAGGVERLLRQPETAFVLVCAPRATSLADAASLRDGLDERGIGLDAVVFNRAYIPEVGQPSVPVSDRVADAPDGAPPLEPEDCDDRLRAALAALRTQVSIRNRLASLASREFSGRLGSDCSVSSVPELPESVRDLAGLLDLAELLEPTGDQS